MIVSAMARVRRLLELLATVDEGGSVIAPHDLVRSDFHSDATVLAFAWSYGLQRRVDGSRE
jgi:hypothetical protein